VISHLFSNTALRSLLDLTQNNLVLIISYFLICTCIYFSRSVRNSVVIQTVSVIIITHTLCGENAWPTVQWLSLWNSTPSAFVVHSEGREDKQVYIYKEMIPGLRVRRLRKHRADNSLETLWFRIQGPFGLWQSFFATFTDGIFFSLSPCFGIAV